MYSFLNAQATKITGYASSPIWSVVDGPWKLASLTSDGTASFVPNPRYSGPQKPHLAKFVELPFTSAAAELSVLRAGQATGGPGTSGQQISVGYVPNNDVPQQPALQAQGYRTVTAFPFGFNYLEPNFNNPTVGPIFRQLYFRQAFQHLIDQPGWISAYYNGLGVPTYSPVPARPANPYADARASVNPYPFSVSAARALLAAHGWRVVPNGVSTCARPGPAAGECGAGVKAGQPLQFTLMYPAGQPYTDGSMADLQSAAKQVGIEISLDQVTSATIAATILSCAPESAACSWEIGNYGTAWIFAPDHYPSGEEIFQTGALGNVNNYSDPAVDQLILATTRTPASGAQAALNAYADQVRLQLPDFWQPSPGTLVTVQSNLHGFAAERVRLHQPGGVVLHQGRRLRRPHGAVHPRLTREADGTASPRDRVGLIAPLRAKETDVAVSSPPNRPDLVVSIPCAEWFAEQEASYQEEALPHAIRARGCVEAGIGTTTRRAAHVARTSLARLNVTASPLTARGGKS